MSKEKGIFSVFSFQGRAKRSEFWAVLITITILFSLIRITEGDSLYSTKNIILAVICSWIGQNGLWQFIPFYAIWLGFVRGTSGDNEYGPDPSGKLS